MMRYFMVGFLFLGTLSYAGQSESSFKSGDCSPDDWDPGTEVEGEIERHVDGDTVRVLIGEDRVSYSVRLLTIDTQETDYYGRSQGHWAEVASESLAEYLPVGTSVLVELGEEPCDYYERMLGYIWKDEENINKKMLEDGLAVNYCIYPNIKYCEEFAQVVHQSMEDEKGIFSEEDVEIPYEWRREVSERDRTKYVGSIFDEDRFVYDPEQEINIPIPDRVYFFTKGEIEDPFEYRNGEFPGESDKKLKNIDKSQFFNLTRY